MIIERNLSTALDKAETDWEGPLDILRTDAIKGGLEEAYDKGLVEPYAAIEFVLEKAKTSPDWKKSQKEVVAKRNARFQRLPPAVKRQYTPEQIVGFINTGKLPRLPKKPDASGPKLSPQQRLAEANRKLAERNEKNPG